MGVIVELDECLFISEQHPLKQGLKLYNIYALVKESSEFRKKVRGESVGRLV